MSFCIRVFVFFCIVCSFNAALASEQTSSHDRFAAANQAIADGDWESAVKILESLVADGVVTAPTLKNLAIARTKQHDLPQALAAWLAARSLDQNDPAIQEGILSTLASLQFGPEAIDLSSHGPVMTWLSERSHQDILVLIYIAMFCLLVAIACVVTVFFSSDRMRKLKHTARLMAVPSIAMTVITWIVALWIYTQSGVWGCVIDPQGAPLRASSTDTATELTRLKPGTPVLITGDTYKKWLNARTADGYHGYVDALHVRVIRTIF